MLADINDLEDNVVKLTKEIGVRDNQIKSMQQRVREAQEASEQAVREYEQKTK